MPVYSWRRRATRHFGNILVPYADISLQGAGGTHYEFALQVDSGATISLLKASAADVLGIRRLSDRRIELSSVAPSKVGAYIHVISTRLNENWPPIAVPYAIADTEDVPNLLGRIGVFDQLQVDFDVSLSETRITARWLDETERRIWDMLIFAEQHIQSRWTDIAQPERVKEAWRRMLARASLLFVSAAGLAKLHRHYAGPLFVRSLFEVAAQFQYLMHDPVARANQYLEFEHVTRYLEQEAYLGAPDNTISNVLREHARFREQDVERVRAEFRKARERFLRSDGRTLWKNWYGLQFRQLIDEISKPEPIWAVEYELCYRKYSGWLHADPFQSDTRSYESQHRSSNLLVECQPYYARMLLRVAELMILTHDQYELLKRLSSSMYSPEHPA